MDTVIGLRPTQASRDWSGTALMVPVMSQDMAFFFNTLAPSDVALLIGAPDQSALRWSRQILQGIVYAVFTSAQVAQATMVALAPTDGITYAPDARVSPRDELYDTVGTVSQLANWLTAMRRPLMLMPGSAISTFYATQIAPFAATYVIDGQDTQGDVAAFANYTNAIYNAVKMGNPHALVAVMLAVHQSIGGYQPVDVVNALEELGFWPDAIAILGTPIDLPLIQQTVALLRG